MIQAPQSRVLPATVDARKLAQQAVELSGLVPVARLPRLSQAVVSADENVQAKLLFSLDEQSHMVVSGEVTVNLAVECQRCLQPTAVPVHSQVAVAVVASDESAKALPERLEPWLVEGADADLYALVEDEILLALPMVAYHSEPCLDQNMYQVGNVDESIDSDRLNPFSVLEQLKGSPKK